MSTHTQAVAKPHPIRKGILTVVLNFICIVFSLTCIFPIVWMIYSSLKEKRVFNADIVGLPKNPTLINYIRILGNSDYHLGESMMNSVRTTAISIVLIVAFSFVVGYILARVRFKMNRPLYVMFLMGMLIPIHYLCSIQEVWDVRSVVYTAVTLCFLCTSHGYLPCGRLCKEYSGFAGRSCSH